MTDAADYLAFFAEDPGTRAVGLFLETVRRPDAFVDALRRCAEADKPVVCLKVGRSEAAARAALSHTGALVGSNRAFSAVLRRYSAIEVDDFHELVETLEILGRRRRPRGMRIAGISESGGECALLADRAEAAGIPFEPLSSDLAARLTGAFPNYLAPGNPLDAWGIADETEVYPRSLELLAASGEFDILVAQADLSQFRDRTNDEWCELTLRTLARLADERDGLFCAMTTVHSADPPRRLPGARAGARRRPSARPAGCHDRVGTRRASPAVRACCKPRGRARRLRPSVRIRRAPRARVGPRPRALRRAVRGATARSHAGRGSRGSSEEIGTPVVVKLDGPAHKARGGGVVLGVGSPQEASEAARRLGGPVLVARQAEPGAEVLCGMTRDPDFGPILAVGRGGIAVEELDRVALSSAPLDARSAAALVAEAGVDDPHGVVAETLVALGDLGLSNPDIESVEVNPLIVGATDTVAVDALVVVAD